VKVAERMIEANGVELCTESFGRPADPPILLIMGIGASMLWWEEGFCRLLAERGRFVIRYDHRDTGRSVTSERSRPEYTSSDLVADAVAVLDVYGIAAAHVVGVSAGGAFAQVLALGYRDRVLSLVLISTSPATPGERGLPPATERYQRFVTTATVDWSDERSVIERSPVHGCSRWRAPDTGSSEPTGSPSPARSSRIPPSPIVAGDLAALEQRG
jgi:pimeloyl-ACP methyl ester carboxylesterase